jgi:hypothetical protein
MDGAPGADADLLIVITPGVERFEYFRHLARIVQGEATPESLLEVQERYDTWFGASPAWAQARGHSNGEPARPRTRAALTPRRYQPGSDGAP